MKRTTKESTATKILILTIGTAVCSIPATMVAMIQHGHATADYVAIVFVPALLIMVVGMTIAAWAEQA